MFWEQKAPQLPRTAPTQHPLSTLPPIMQFLCYYERNVNVGYIEYKVYIYVLLHESLLVDKRMGAEVRVVMVVVLLMVVVIEHKLLSTKEWVKKEVRVVIVVVWLLLLLL
jgi:hypothetical protein